MNPASNRQLSKGVSARERRALARARLLDANDGKCDMAFAIRTAHAAALSYAEIAILLDRSEREVRILGTPR